MVNSVYVSVVLDTRKQLKDGKYPVKLRLTYNRKQRYFPVGMTLHKDEYDKATSARPRGEFKELSIKLANIEHWAKGILADMPLFSFAEFGRKLKGPQREKDDVLGAFEDYMNELISEQRLSTANTYKVTLNAIKKFMGRKSILSFIELDIEWLHAFEKWMLDRGRSITTVGINARNIRSIYNQAIDKGIISRDYYPFGKRKYQIPASRNVKKALTLSEIQQIFDYQPDDYYNKARSRDYWVFIYLCNGINMKDMAYLEWANIDDESIVFNRSKTRNTKRSNQKPIVAVMTKEIQNILEKWANDRHFSKYVFPILTEGMDIYDREKRVSQIIQTTNKFMRQIAKELGINKPLTTYVARHSYATVLKRSGAPIQFISEALGHSNLQTTESYLDSFEQKTRLEYAKKLTDFSSLNIDAK